MVKCSKHPSYTGVRAIRRADDQCPKCQEIRDAFLKSGVKEKRVRAKKVPVVSALETPVEAVSSQSANVSPVVAAVNVPPPNPAVDDELPGGLGDDFDVNTGDLNQVL